MVIPGKKPPWLRRRLPSAGRSGLVVDALRSRALHTVCEEAHCPNQMECYSKGTATFLLLGPSCTRGCTFCAVDKSGVRPVDPDEPVRVAEAVAEMSLRYCVLTMVTRDDLSDGGAGHVACTVRAIREKGTGVGVEVLISDLAGDRDALETVLAAGPDVLNHNLETVPRLYSSVRPQADYRRSLELIGRAAAHRPALVIKSGVMLGLGETREEILALMDDLLEAGCRFLTLGQYLAPSERHHPIVRYVTPEEFEDYGSEALGRGFHGVASGPLVRSSYQAEQMYKSVTDLHTQKSRSQRTPS